MASRSTYELAKPLAIHLLQNITTLSKHKAAKPGKIYMETEQKSAPRLYASHYYTNSSTTINNNECSSRFILSSVRTNIGRASLASQGIKLWNKGIPETIKKSAKYSLFSKKLRQHFSEGNDLILI